MEATRDIMPYEEPIVSIDIFKSFEIEAKSDEARAEVASMLDQEIGEKLKEGILSQIQAGYYLHVMKESGVYKGIGDHVIKWKDYVEKELGLSTGTDSNLRGIATEFGPFLAEHPELTSVDYKRLTEVLTLFRRNRDRLEGWLRSRELGPGEERKEEGETVEAEIVIDLEEVGEEHGDERKTDIEYDDDDIKEALLRDADVLPRKAWEDVLKEIKGEPTKDSCSHEGEYDVLHRCRSCGQVYAPEEGHSESFVELEGLSDEQLVKEYLDAVEKGDGEKARHHTHAQWHKRKKKFVVCEFEKSEDGIYSTNMKEKEYERKGFMNKVIEKRGGCGASN